MRFGSPGEIYFRCTACEGRLAAAQGEVGRLVDCPACQAAILVPAKSTVWPPGLRRFLFIGATQVLVLGLVVGGVVHLLARQRENGENAPGTTIRAPVAKASQPAELGPDRAPTSKSRTATDTPDRSFQDLQTAHRALNKQYDELANWVLSNMRGRFLLKEKFVKNLHLSPLTEEYLLHPDMMDYLEVSPKERDLLEDALGFGLTSMATLETKFLSVTQSTPERVAVHIPPYEQEGAAMQDDLYRAMETVLGSDRFGRLLDAGEKDLIKRYHYFGAAARTMVFQLTAAEDPSEPPYLVIRDGWIIPDGVGKRSIQVAETSVRELPRDYMPYLSWLPEFVAAYAKP